MVMACLSTFQGDAIIICLCYMFHGMFLVAVHSTCDISTDLFHILYLLNMSLVHISQFGSDLYEIPFK